MTPRRPRPRASLQPLSHAATAPAVAPPPRWRFPQPTSAARLGNGLDVLWYRLPGQHVLAATLVLDLPLSREPRDLEGLATITARVLDEGTVDHPGEQFAERLEAVGAAMGIHVSLSGQQVMLDVPVTRVAEALPLLAEAVRRPRLEAADVERHVALRLAEIEQLEANSAQTANRWLRRQLWTPDSRASRMNGGEPDTVARITPVEVAAFHAGQLGPTGATLVLAGDLAEDPLDLVADAFAGWQANPAGPELARPEPAPPSVLLVDRPGAVQADVRLAGPGTDRHDPRWPALLVGTTAVGGSFLSRLNRVLREERGWTYGVHLNLTPHRDGGSWAVSGSFRTEVVGAALAEARSLLDLGAEPLTAAETEAAVHQLTGTLPLRAATAEGVVDQVASHLLAGLPADHADQLLADVRQVGPEAATAAYTEVVDPAAPTVVVVGDAGALEPALEQAGFPVTERR
ncbi:insulinase family protein [Auraticoccus sp. F435]|uniref:Insulinase family protein n=1 Tax=Auraticoccus cholistanensis TaxID=2656650 RepID=A0A6A9UT60_9ACTN|nr:pitrilysin family protein [Auraticoccus cholistanensis]MVA76116.1 insulinase family protein [Auraticoccus cholistanensis]